ncbi:MAG: hypothetical protein JW918_00965 [Anaerolineae bacterium]|nr:hypothetical protein [Anaerolineae bacterium]
MTSYQVYRNGGGTIEARIKAACQLFYKDRRRAPVQVVVNPAEHQAAREACGALALAIPVASSGGCLIPEVWLQLPDESRAAEPKQLKLI